MTRTNCKHTSSNLPLTFTYWKNHLTFFRFSIVSVYLNTGKSPVRTFNNEVNGEIMPRREKNTWILFLIYFINYSGIHMIHSGWKVDDTSHDSLKDKKFLSASENSDSLLPLLCPPLYPPLHHNVRLATKLTILTVTLI